MLTLNLTRQWFTANSTCGVLDIMGIFQCYTLELPSGLCIPPGTYQISLYPSPKFGRMMPLLNEVSGRTNIEIHWGNTAADTDGCILIGDTHSPDFIGNSREAFAVLFPLIQAAVKDGGCQIVIWGKSLPSAADLDATAAEEAIREATGPEAI